MGAIRPWAIFGIAVCTWNGASAQTLVSIADDNATFVDASCFAPDTTPDASLVVFHTTATNLLVGSGGTDPIRSDIYLRDLNAPTTLLVSNAGIPSLGRCREPSISDDGSRIAFEVDNAGIYGMFRTIFLRDMNAAAPVAVSLSPIGQFPNGHCSNAAISGDGEWIAFESTASNLRLFPDTNGKADVYLVEVATGWIERISNGLGGAEPNGFSRRPTISRDGRYVAWSSRASNLVAGTATKEERIYVLDRVSGTTSLVSRDVNGSPAAGRCTNPSISSDGLRVAFQSSVDLTGGVDTNGNEDVYLVEWTLPPASGVHLVSQHHAGGATTVGDSERPSISDDGEAVAFHSNSLEIVAGETANGCIELEVYVRHVAAGFAVKHSATPGGGEACGPSGTAVANGDGSRAVFSSYAVDLVVPSSPFAEIYLR